MNASCTVNISPACDKPANVLEEEQTCLFSRSWQRAADLLRPAQVGLFALLMRMRRKRMAPRGGVSLTSAACIKHRAGRLSGVPREQRVGLCIRRSLLESSLVHFERAVLPLAFRRSATRCAVCHYFIGCKDDCHDHTMWKYCKKCCVVMVPPPLPTPSAPPLFSPNAKSWFWQTLMVMCYSTCCWSYLIFWVETVLTKKKKTMCVNACICDFKKTECRISLFESLKVSYLAHCLQPPVKMRLQVSWSSSKQCFVGPFTCLEGF